MNKNKIIQSVKRQEEEKVGFSLKLPASLKNQLQKLAESESISMNALIVATLQSMIDDDCGREIDKYEKDVVIAKSLLSDYKNDLAFNIEKMEDFGVDEDNVIEFNKLNANYNQTIEFLEKD